MPASRSSTNRPACSISSPSMPSRATPSRYIFSPGKLSPSTGGISSRTAFSPSTSRTNIFHSRPSLRSRPPSVASRLCCSPTTATKRTKNPPPIGCSSPPGPAFSICRPSLLLPGLSIPFPDSECGPTNTAASIGSFAELFFKTAYHIPPPKAYYITQNIALAQPAMKTRLLLSAALAASLLPAQVTYERLLHADKEPQNWLTYSGSYAGIRFSPLHQINTSNVRNLQMKWVYH